MTSRNTTFLKAILLLIGLGMIGALVGCSSSNSTPTVTVAITATSGGGQSANAGATFANPLVANVTTNGTATSGATVTFTCPASGASCTFTSSGTATETDTTDANGNATSSLPIANTTAGTYSVTASVALASTAATFSLTNNSGPVVAVLSGSPQDTATSTAFALPLSVSVTLGGSAVPDGTTVTFTAPASGASGTFTSNGTATETDTTTGGVATSSVFTANATAGGYTVVASTPGGTSANFILGNESGTAASIVATSGDGQSATAGTGFTNPLVATLTDAGSNPVVGALVTFTCPASGASCTFASNGTATETDATDVNGNATSSAVTANGTAGSYSVTAADFDNPAITTSFGLTNNPSSTPVTLAPGNYVFQVTGTDTNDSFYTYAGTFNVNASGAITGGEQDFSDYNYFVSAEAITGGTVTASSASASGDSNILITLNFDPSAETYINNGAGFATLDASLVSASQALIIEFDNWATSSGELDLQATTLSQPATTGYAFFLGGVDGDELPLSIGGVMNVDGTGTISGDGSIFDVNDEGELFPGLALSASTVTAPDAFGFVTFTLNSPNISGSPGLILDGYMVDANHIRLVENWEEDSVEATTGGSALGQTGTGTFSNASISGSTYVFGTAGSDTVTNVLTVAGQLTFNADGTVSGNLSYNDFASQSPQGGTTLATETATYSVDAAGAGDVTITGLTDNATFVYNLQLYLTGDGHAYVISMDADNPFNGDSADVLAGRSVIQTTSPITAGTFSGTYSLGLGGVDGNTFFEQDGVGTIVSDGVGTFAGFQDQNQILVNGTQTVDGDASGTFAITSTNGVFTVNPGGGGSVTAYIADPTQGVVIENDDSDVNLGYYVLQAGGSAKRPSGSAKKPTKR